MKHFNDWAGSAASTMTIWPPTFAFGEPYQNASCAGLMPSPIFALGMASIKGADRIETTACRGLSLEAADDIGEDPDIVVVALEMIECDKLLPDGFERSGRRIQIPGDRVLPSGVDQRDHFVRIGAAFGQRFTRG